MGGGFGIGSPAHVSPSPSGDVEPPAPSVSPILSLNFKAGTYSLGDASRSVSDLVVNNVDMGGSYSTDNIVTGVGLVSSVDATGDGPADDVRNKLLLSTEAAANLLSGFIAVATVRLNANASDYQSYANLFVQLIDMVGGNMAWDFAVIAEHDGTVSSASVQIEDYADAYDRDWDVPVASAYKVAGMMSRNGVAASVNGRTALSVSPVQVNSATHVALTLSAVVTTATGSASCTLEKIEFFSVGSYPGVDLATLSV